MDHWFPVVAISAMGPVIGSLLGVTREPSEKLMFNMLAFAAGVMLAISFLDLIPESIALSSVPVCAVGIIVGAFCMYLLDIILPHIHPELCQQEQGLNLKKTSTYLLVGIFLHNFPEGLAIAVGTVSDSRMTVVIAAAIAIHNIPEGMCTATPFYHVTGRRWKSFLVSASTAIPIVAGYFFATTLYQHISEAFIGFIVGGTAGLMIYISADELIPSSCWKITNHSTIFSLIAGVILVVLLGGI